MPRPVYAPASSPAWDAFNLSGLVAVITSGDSGLGLMFTKALEANGAAEVYMIGRIWHKLEAAAQSEGIHVGVIPLSNDVSSRQSLQDCVHYMKARDGYVNLLVFSAGRSGPGMDDDRSQLKTIDDFRSYLLYQDMDDFTNTYHVNVTSSFYTAVTFVPLLDAGNKKRSYPVQSQVIGMASSGSYARGLHGSIAYGISKTSIHQLMQNMATYLAPWGILFNALKIVGFRSELTEQIAAFKLTDPRAEDEGSFPATFSTVRRSGREVEAAGAILYLASLSGGYTNGAVLLGDGVSCSVMPSAYG